MITVHILHQGYPLCGFSMRVPAEWPADHHWERIENADHELAPGSTWCLNCQQRKKQMNVE